MNSLLHVFESLRQSMLEAGWGVVEWGSVIVKRLIQKVERKSHEDLGSCCNTRCFVFLCIALLQSFRGGTADVRHQFSIKMSVYCVVFSD